MKTSFPVAFLCSALSLCKKCGMFISCTPAVVLRVLVRAALQQFLRGLARFGARFGERCLRGAYQRRHAPFVDGVDTRAFGQQQPHGAFAVGQRRVVQHRLPVLVAAVEPRVQFQQKAHFVAVLGLHGLDQRFFQRLYMSRIHGDKGPETKRL